MPDDESIEDLEVLWEILLDLLKSFAMLIRLRYQEKGLKTHFCRVIITSKLDYIKEKWRLFDLEYERKTKDFDTFEHLSGTH